MKRIEFCFAIMAMLVFFPMPSMSQTELEVAHWWTSEGEARAVGVLKTAFEKTGHKWKDAGIEGGGGEKLTSVLKARAGAGNPPAAVQVYMGPNLQRWAEEGMLANLNVIAMKDNWQKVLPPLINRMIQYEGKYYGAPINAHRVNSMWINPEVIRKAGSKVPGNWDEFLDIADTIQKAGYIPLALGGQPWQEATLFESVLLDIGGAAFHRKAIQELDGAALKSDTMVRVFEMMRKIKPYTDRDSPGRAWDAATAMVMEGKAAMQIMGDWAKGEFLAAGKKPGVDFLCRPAPGTDDLFLIVTDTFAIFKTKDEKIRKAQNILAAMIMNPDVQERFNIIKGSVPARLGIACDKFDSCACGAMKVFQDAASKDRIVPAFSYFIATFPEVAEAWTDLISKHFNSEMSARDAAGKFAAAALLAE